MNITFSKIKIKGITARAKGRIGTFGKDGIFFLKRDLRPVENKVLVEALEPNLKLSDTHTIPWGGWFDIGTEIEVLEDAEKLCPILPAITELHKHRKTQNNS